MKFLTSKRRLVARGSDGSLRGPRSFRISGTALAISLALGSGCSVTDKFKNAASGDDAAADSTPRILNFLEAPSYSVGNVAASGTKLIFLSVATTGAGDATIDSVSNSDSAFTFNGGTFPGTGGTCGQPISGNCSIAVLYSAPAGIGTASDTVTVNYTSGDVARSATVALYVNVVAPASVSVNGGAAKAFGTHTIGTSTDATLSVANAGTMTAGSLVFSGLSAPLGFKGGTYPGTGGTCGNSVAAASTCTVVVTYAPSASVATSQTLTLSYNDGTGAASTNISVTGTGVAAPRIVFTAPASDPYDYGAKAVGAAETFQTFTIQNTGGQTASSLAGSGLAPPFRFEGGAYPGTTGTCGNSLAVGGSCTVVVGYLPTGSGSWSDSVVIGYDDGAGGTATQTFGVIGTSSSPALLTISDGPTYDYGVKTLSSSTDWTFTVTNSGGTNATALSPTALSAPYAFKGGAFPGTGGSCVNAGTLLAGTACTVVITFTPTVGGAASTNFTLGYNSGIAVTSASRPITGTGGAAANLTISDGPTYDFGTVAKGYTKDKTFTVTNSGSQSASSMAGIGLSAPLTYKDGNFPGTGGSCGATLAVGASCTIVVTFAPTSAAAASQTVSVTYDDGISTTSSNRPITATGATISKIAAGAAHTCALHSNGIVKCWGAGTLGQLGNGTGSDSAVPVDTGLTTATDIAAGSNHTCARLSNSRIYCWGSDSDGQIGDNAALANQLSPALVATYTDFTAVAAGGNTTCGVRSGGTAACWGDDTTGAVGDNAAFSSVGTPALVSGLNSTASISVGVGFACARRSNSQVRCWGSNASGQLGDSTGVDSGVPVTPAGPITTASSIHVGGSTAACRLSGGSVSVWGSDSDGQLGDDIALADQSAPAAAAGLASVSAIAMGRAHGCALTAGATIACWGDDFFGQLGDDASTTDQPTPVAVTGIASATVVGAGEYHSCAVVSSGLVYCWGRNDSNQLGDATGTQQPTPVQALGL